jgi:hypothetical protein
MDGKMWAAGRRGLYVFNSVSEPQLVRKDLLFTGNPQCLSQNNQALTCATTTGFFSYGKLIPDVPFALFNLNSTVYNIIRTDLNSSVAYMATDTKLYFMNLLTKSASAVDQIEVATSKISLGGLYSIGQVDIIFQDKLTTGAQLNDFTIDNEGGKLNTTTVFGSITHTANGAVGSASLVPAQTYANNDADGIRLIWTQNGLVQIKRIDIYGESGINRD